jgi:hypothetical protein
MLAHRLRNPLAYQLIHPIGVCICGILSNFVAIMRVFRESKQVITLKKIDLNQINTNNIIRQAADGTLTMSVDAANQGRDFFSDNNEEQMSELSDTRRFLPESTRQDINLNRRMEYQ